MSLPLSPQYDSQDLDGQALKDEHSHNVSAACYSDSESVLLKSSFLLLIH